MYLCPEWNCAVRGPIHHSSGVYIYHISLALYGNSKCLVLAYYIVYRSTPHSNAKHIFSARYPRVIYAIYAVGYRF